MEYQKYLKRNQKGGNEYEQEHSKGNRWVRRGHKAS